MQPTLPGVEFEAVEHRCAVCGRKFTPTPVSPYIGPVCARRVKNARLVQSLLAQRPTTTKPKRLSVPKTKPFARIAGNKCDRAPEGCTNQATLSLGRGRYRLCDVCAIRSEFDRFSVRVPLKAVAR